MPWVETHSLSFSARHGSADAVAAEALLDRLEAFRARLEERFPIPAGDVAVVVHPRAAQLDLAAPWLPVARAATAPASRRYVAGWFTRGKIHTLTPRALEDRASAVPGSREALRLAPLHEYVHVVVGANCPGLPPPFSPASFLRYLRLAWISEGAATHFSGQSRLLRGAVARRLREGSSPSFPPSVADALLLGGRCSTCSRRQVAVRRASRWPPGSSPAARYGPSSARSDGPSARSRSTGASGWRPSRRPEPRKPRGRAGPARRAGSLRQPLPSGAHRPRGDCRCAPRPRARPALPRRPRPTPRDRGGDGRGRAPRGGCHPRRALLGPRVRDLCRVAGATLDC
ncbi:MAG: hypothetical protein WKF31_00730 [Thermoleophilaceae bacterium]